MVQFRQGGSSLNAHWTSAHSCLSGPAFIDIMGSLPPLLLVSVLVVAVVASSQIPNFVNDDNNEEAKPRERKRVKRITFGSEASYGDFPHQVSIYHRARGHFCSASIIHPLLLLSVAHCFQRHTRKPPNLFAKAGIHSLRLSHGTAHQIRDVIHVFPHHKFSMETYDHDIAILVLNQSLEFNNFVSPIKLGDLTWKLPDRANVSGWSRRIENSTGGRIWDQQLSDTLEVEQVPIVTHENCTERYKDFKNKITENMICAEGKGSDACQGDSGGPLTCLGNRASGEEERYLCGIISWGRRCDIRRVGQLPGVYTDVSKYRDWVNKFMRTWDRHHWVIKLSEPRGRRNICGAGKFDCPNNGLCIPQSFKCNGRNDCVPVEVWDETDCPSITCARGTFRCHSTQSCIPSIYVCDGHGDCWDGFDELDCE